MGVEAFVRSRERGKKGRSSENFPPFFSSFSFLVCLWFRILLLSQTVSNVSPGRGPIVRIITARARLCCWFFTTQRHTRLKVHYNSSLTPTDFFGKEKTVKSRFSLVREPRMPVGWKERKAPKESMSGEGSPDSSKGGLQLTSLSSRKY